MAWGIRDPHKQAQIEERARRERWETPGAARVTHPDHGTVVVPHRSNYAAILNAAEVWRCRWADIIDATVYAAEPGDKVEKMPYLF